MIRQQDFLVSFSIVLLWTSGCLGGSDVSQTPMLWKSVGQDATMECSHTKGPGYFQMYWYRQLPGETMKLIVFTSTASKDHDFGDFSKEKFSASKTDPERGSFTVKSLEPEDKGLYFCAVRTGTYTDPAYFGQGTKLTVLDETPVTPPTVKILQTPKCQDKDGNVKNKTLVCVASGFYPDHVGVSWTRNDLKITEGVSTDAAAKRGKDNYYKITSRLTIPNTDSIKPNIRFKCIVSFYNGTANIEKDDVFTTKRTLIPGMTRANYLKITQNAKLSYSALIVKSLLYAALVGLLVWKLQGKRGKQTK